MRNTKQRELVLSVVSASCSHPTALEVYTECSKAMPNISLGTVYRNLHSLVKQGNIRKLKMPDNIDRYDRIDKHVHFICVRCGKILDIYKNFFEYDLDMDGNKILDCQISFEGICQDCLKKEGEL